MKNTIASVVAISILASGTAVASQSEELPWWKQGLEYFQPTQAEKLQDASEDHKDNVEEFRDCTADLSDSLVDQKNEFLVFKAALQASEGQSETAHKILDEWSEVIEEVDDLRATFDALSASANQYFKEAAARAMQIEVNKVREETLASVAEGRAQYQKRLGATRQRVMKLAGSTREAESIMIALEVNVSMRQVMADANAGFAQIEKRIDGVMSSLQRLSQDGKELLSFEVI